jgi:hypothetical protein
MFNVLWFGPFETLITLTANHRNVVNKLISNFG